MTIPQSYPNKLDRYQEKQLEEIEIIRDRLNKVEQAVRKGGENDFNQFNPNDPVNPQSFNSIIRTQALKDLPLIY